jgi:hypothetical protein
MRRYRIGRLTTAAAILAGAAWTLACAPARADVAIDAGAFATHGVAGGAALSIGVFGAPVLPLAGDLTVAAPLNGQGYAATFDLRASVGDTTLGGGAGVGNLAATGTTSLLYDAIVAHRVLPHLAVEGRVYLGPHRPSAVFAGLRLSL